MERKTAQLNIAKIMVSLTRDTEFSALPDKGDYSKETYYKVAGQMIEYANRLLHRRKVED